MERIFKKTYKNDYDNDYDNDHFYESNLNAEYDGTDANISVKTNIDGNKRSIKVLLDKEDLIRLNKEKSKILEMDDLASILNLDVQFENDKPENTIYDRLMKDFISSENMSSRDPKTYYIELPEKYNTQNRNINSIPSQVEELFKKEKYINIDTQNISNSKLHDKEMVVPIVFMNLQPKKMRKQRRTKKSRKSRRNSKKTRRTKKSKKR